MGIEDGRKSLGLLCVGQEPLQCVQAKIRESRKVRYWECRRPFQNFEGKQTSQLYEGIVLGVLLWGLVLQEKLIRASSVNFQDGQVNVGYPGICNMPIVLGSPRNVVDAQATKGIWDF